MRRILKPTVEEKRKCFTKHPAEMVLYGVIGSAKKFVCGTFTSEPDETLAGAAQSPVPMLSAVNAASSFGATRDATKPNTHEAWLSVQSRHKEPRSVCAGGDGASPRRKLYRLDESPLPG